MEYKARDGETDAGFLMEKFHAQQQIPTLLNNWGQLLSTIFFSLLVFFLKKLCLRNLPSTWLILQRNRVGLASL